MNERKSLPKQTYFQSSSSRYYTYAIISSILIWSLIQMSSTYGDDEYLFQPDTFWLPLVSEISKSAFRIIIIGIGASAYAGLYIGLLTQKLPTLMWETTVMVIVSVAVVSALYSSSITNSLTPIIAMTLIALVFHQVGVTIKHLSDQQN